MSEERPFGLGDRITVVIGAGSGIGAAIATAFARQGATTVCLDLNGEAAAREQAKISADGGVAESQALDIRDAAAVAACFQDVRDRRGRIDTVVSTPAVNVRKPMLDYEIEELDRVIDLNLKGTFHVLQAGGRLMREQKSGSLIALSSIRSVVVEPGQAVYAATKAGIVQLVRTLAAELGPFGVRVNAIAPGVVETPLTGPILANPDWYDAYAAKSALQRWAKPEEIAGPAVFLASDASSFVTGTVLFVDGGWTAIDGRFTPPGM